MKHIVFDATTGEKVEIPLTSEEIQQRIDLDNANRLAEIREQRDAYLKATDYMLLEDSTLTTPQKNTLKAYRQSLRDLPASDPNPFQIALPSRPSFVKEIDFARPNNARRA